MLRLALRARAVAASATKRSARTAAAKCFRRGHFMSSKTTATRGSQLRSAQRRRFVSVVDASRLRNSTQKQMRKAATTTTTTTTTMTTTASKRRHLSSSSSSEDADANRRRELASGFSVQKGADGHYSAERPIYLDMQATTPVDPRVLDARMPFFTQRVGNPHSRTPAYGWEAETAVEQARAVRSAP
jgi:cysteine desulfurase